MGALCGGGGGNTTTVTSAPVPKYLEDFSKETIDRADTISQQPYQPFTGEAVAGLNQDYANAFDTVRDSAGVYQPVVNRAIDRTEAAGAGYGKTYSPGTVTPQQVTPGSLAGTDLSAYMNPFTQSVIDSATGDIDRSRQIALNRSGAAAAQNNAFGGARHGVVEAEVERNTQEARARAVANLMLQNYGQAQSAATGDITRDMQAQLANQGIDLGAQQFNQQMGLSAYGANAGVFGADQQRLLQSGQQLGSLGQLSQGMNLTDVAQMLGIGEIQRGADQQQKDFDYQSYLRQFNYPFDVTNFRTAQVTGQPQSRNETTTGPGGSSAASNLGLFALMAGGGMNIFG